MSDRATRLQVKLIAVMTILMWWAYLVSHRSTIFPSREERRQVFPPGMSDPYRQFRYRFAGLVRHPPVHAIGLTTSGDAAFHSNPLSRSAID